MEHVSAQTWVAPPLLVCKVLAPSARAMVFERTSMWANDVWLMVICWVGRPQRAPDSAICRPLFSFSDGNPEALRPGGKRARVADSAATGQSLPGSKSLSRAPDLPATGSTRQSATRYPGHPTIAYRRTRCSCLSCPLQSTSTTTMVSSHVWRRLTVRSTPPSPATPFATCASRRP